MYHLDVQSKGLPALIFLQHNLLSDNLLVSEKIKKKQKKNYEWCHILKNKIISMKLEFTLVSWIGNLTCVKQTGHIVPEILSHT